MKYLKQQSKLLKKMIDKNPHLSLDRTKIKAKTSINKLMKTLYTIDTTYEYTTEYK